MTTHTTRLPHRGMPADGLTQALHAEFAARWPGHAPGLDAILHYALVPAGKLLRPQLVALSALAVGGTLERVLPAAVGFKYAHVGSMVHDDIIDTDAVRRGRPATHTQFGTSRAIIAGNALYFAWFSALAECGARGAAPHQVARSLAIQAEAAQEACRGGSRGDRHVR
ncbi:polyprenyl synthetase family protein [Streptomyces violascens]|uniref:polyprenyl synthetase family protein n=1 Tax=Streptomyces violascens TaxID=67381 RepID=UPI0036BDAAF2